MAEMLVLDALMGQGKTMAVHQEMKRMHKIPGGECRWIYIAPYLSELDRIRKACPELDFQLPSDPDNPQHGAVYQDFKKLVKEGHNIAASHSAFKMFDDDMYKLVTKGSYVLVIDETLPVIEKYQGCKKHDFDMLLRTGKLVVGDDHVVEWNHKDWANYRGEFEHVRRDADAGVLVAVNGSILIWRFPAQFLDAFAAIYVCTYLFEGSLMSNYLKANNRQYWLGTIAQDGGNYWMVPYDQGNNYARKQELKKLIRICEDPALNAVGQLRAKRRGERGRQRQPLSHNWFKTELEWKPSLRGEKNGVKQLKANLDTWFRYRLQAKAADIMWTTFGGKSKGNRAIINRLKGNGYTRGFVSHSAKATNEYQDRWALAYCLNKFIDVDVADYFKAHGLAANENLYALSELVQWIFRSRIRKDPAEPIDIYIPSERMRGLLKLWMEHSDQDIISGEIWREQRQAT